MKCLKVKSTKKYEVIKQKEKKFLNNSFEYIIVKNQPKTIIKSIPFNESTSCSLKRKISCFDSKNGSSDCDDGKKMLSRKDSHPLQHF